MFEIHTTVDDNRTVTAEKWNRGSDGFIHAKNGSITVASIATDEVKGIFRQGAG